MKNNFDSVTCINTENGWVTTSIASLNNYNGGQLVETITATQTASILVDTYLVDTSSGAVVLTLPTATTLVGKIWNIKLIDATNILTIIGATGTIDGAVDADLTALNDSLTIQFDGTNFKII